MKLTTIANSLWGEKANTKFLFLAAILSLFTFLGAHEIWTQEHRWADIVIGMFYRNDFLHPYLGQSPYYDKPLLSYWLMVALSYFNHAVTTWTLRLPSAFAGLLAIWSIYRLGAQLKNKELGLLAGWLLLTTYYFVFWARTSSADMLNMAGSLFAIAWYIDKRDHANFFDYSVFFIILALTSLCKGLVGLIVPMLAVFVDIVLQKSWREHLRPTLFLALLPALVIYLLPFLASSYFGGDAFKQNGLYLVYKENILRYFKPFDHQGSIFTYFIYLPIYILPWAFLFFPALFSLKSRWKTLSLNSKWIVFTLALLFLFFSLSGSRRSYYVLPMVPFALLLTADWILSGTLSQAKKQIWSAGLVVFSFIFLYAVVNLIPAWYYAQYGAGKFAAVLQAAVSDKKPLKTWDIILLDAESKMNFYLQLPPNAKNFHVKGIKRLTITEAQLAAAWPFLKDKSTNTIYVSRKLYAPFLKTMLVGYKQIEMPYPTAAAEEAPVAFIPNN